VKVVGFPNDLGKDATIPLGVSGHDPLEGRFNLRQRGDTQPLLDSLSNYGYDVAVSTTIAPDRRHSSLLHCSHC
jgi:hypothetical protein